MAAISTQSDTRMLPSYLPEVSFDPLFSQSSGPRKSTIANSVLSKVLAAQAAFHGKSSPPTSSTDTVPTTRYLMTAKSQS